MVNKLLFEGSEWDFNKLDRTWKAIDDIGTNQLGLDYYEPQIEIISSEQMVDNYSTHAMPIMYAHWSFGKEFVRNEEGYKKGTQGLAYEVVINTNPSIAYLMETNTMTMQALVMAHASVGHSGFFKNNYLFKDWSDASSILDYLKFARSYMHQCEEKYGKTRVEELLDACHALSIHGVDKYKRPHIKKEFEKNRREERQKFAEHDFNDVWRTVPEQKKTNKKVKINKKMFPEENILYFIEKYSPVLRPWQKEIVRIVRKISQYFYPQRQTQLMNEGWATFIHYTIMNMMFDQGLISAGSILEFLKSHSGVVYQPDWNDRYYSGINVYALGFAMMQDIKRICTNPDEEDKQLFPQICNTDWLTTMKTIVENYRDESFVLQFLSPKVIKQFKLFAIDMDERKRAYEVIKTQDEEYLLSIRNMLSAQYDLSKRVPHLEIAFVDFEDTRRMVINHIVTDEVRLDHESAKKAGEYLHILWGHTIQINYVNANGEEI